MVEMVMKVMKMMGIHSYPVAISQADVFGVPVWNVRNGNGWVMIEVEAADIIDGAAVEMDICEIQNENASKIGPKMQTEMAATMKTKMAMQARVLAMVQTKAADVRTEAAVWVLWMCWERQGRRAE